MRILSVLVGAAWVVCILGAALAAWMLFGARSSSDPPGSGWGARWIGDVDGDGVVDVALGISGPRGRTLILAGSDGSHLSRIFPGSRLGDTWSVLGPAGDLDGDGGDEVWWSEGRDLVLRGPSGFARRFRWESSDLVAVLGDLDGDGVPELAIGGHPVSGDEDDRISAVSPRTGAIQWTTRRAAPRAGSLGTFGWIGCTAGDVDLDGVPDLAVCDQDDRVEILSGRDGSTLRRTSTPSYWIGGAIAPLGDLDGDGRPEVLSFAEWNRPTRVVSCVAGRELAVLPGPRWYRGVYSPGDVDGDGQADIAWTTTEGAEVVRALDGARILFVAGAEFEPGRADVDGDGCADLLAVRNVVHTGAGPAPDDLWRRGRVEIVSGRSHEVLRAFDAESLGLER